MPNSNTGDGVSSNIKAARVLHDFFGFDSPDYRCAVHAANGTQKTACNIKNNECSGSISISICISVCIP